MKRLLPVVLITALFLSWAEELWADGKDDRDGRDTEDLQSWSRAIDTPRRFVVLKDFKGEAVLDRETQLVWQRTPGFAVVANFQGSLLHCYSASTGNRLGWRLPTVEELTSLLVGPASQSSSGTLPPQNPFIGVLGGETRYWSITAGSEVNAVNNTVTNIPGRLTVGTNLGNTSNTVSTVGLEVDLTGTSHPSWCVRARAAARARGSPKCPFVVAET